MALESLPTQTGAAEPAARGGCFRFEMPVRWGDLDALNHVNNTVYFRYMEEARIHWARACGISVTGNGRNIVLAHAACDFLRPVLWPATLLLDMRVHKVGRSSIELEIEIGVKGDTQGPYARARNIIVGIDAATGRSAPWSAAELQGLEKVFATSET